MAGSAVERRSSSTALTIDYDDDDQTENGWLTARRSSLESSSLQARIYEYTIVSFQVWLRNLGGG